MEELTWGIPLFFDLWAAGMAGGAFFAAFLIDLLGADQDRRLLKVATYIGVPLVLLGVFTLIIDLGEPFRAWHLFVGLSPFLWQVLPETGAAAWRVWPPSLAFYPLSPMSLGSWILVVWSIAGVILIVLWLAESIAARGQPGGLVRRTALALRPIVPLQGILIWINFVFAILMMTYTGVVLSASSRALWQTTFLMPSLFVASAITTGVAALMAVTHLTRARQSAAPAVPWSRMLRTLLLIQLVVLAGLLLWLGIAGAAGPLISGTMGLAFWIGVVLLGLLVPLGLEWGVLQERLGTGHLMLVSPVLVLLGGLILRAVIVTGGQI